MDGGLHHVELVMGTAVTIEIVDAPPHLDLAALCAGACDWFHEVDARFSTYRPDSEVSRLDRGALAAVDASTDLRGVLEACADLWAATGGYFDAHATGRLDPSGYVKGWSVQVASDRLCAAGATNHCVNAGGDVRVRGHDAAGRPWRIGVTHPWQRDRVAWVLASTDLAVATSGTYERGPHVIDPYRGRPATALRSVTVAGPDLGIADGYATAAVAMGERGIEWLATLDGYAAAAVTEDGRAFRSGNLPATDSRPSG